MTMRPGYSNISCTEDQCAFNGAVMSTEQEVSIEKKDKVFLKRLQLFFNLFLREQGKIISSIKRERSIHFKQLLVKEIRVNGPWRLDFIVPQRSLLLSWPIRNYLCFLFNFPRSERFSHETIQKRF